MYNHAFVKAFQLTDLVSPLANQVSVPDSKGLAHNSRVIWLVIAGMSVATIVGYWATGLTFAWYCIQTIGLCALPFLAVSLFYRRLRPDPLISFATEAFAQLLLVLTLGSALSYPLAAAGFPYRDALLNSADTWMGLDWRAYLKFVNDRPLLGTITKLAYDSPLAQLMVLMTILVPTLRFVRLQRFVLASALRLPYSPSCRRPASTAF
jgi:hypothetical protein